MKIYMLTPKLLWLFLLALFVLSTAFKIEKEPLYAEQTVGKSSNELLKQKAFEILQTKCNVCHRKRNPFMVFNHKNMAKRAPKIYQMVFVEKRMPKGDEVRLTQQEYAALEKWLLTQKLF